MSINDGGSAFPVPGTFIQAKHGMTLRDYFAASVIGQLAASPLRVELTTEQDASYAYRVADAMLEAREAK